MEMAAVVCPLQDKLRKILFSEVMVLVLLCRSAASFGQHRTATHDDQTGFCPAINHRFMKWYLKVKTYPRTSESYATN